MRRVLIAGCLIALSLLLAVSRGHSQQRSSAADATPARGTVRTIVQDVAAKSGAPFSLAVGNDGTVFVAVSGADAASRQATAAVDPMVNRVLVVEPKGSFRVFAGTGARGFLGDGGAATDAELNLAATPLATFGASAQVGVEAACCAPASATLAFVRSGMAVDAEGDVFIADTQNSTIRLIAGTASTEPMIIRSVAGRWAGPSKVELVAPASLAMDSAGNLYMADAGTNAIVVLRGSELTTLAHVIAPGAIAVNSAGTKIYVASLEAGRVFQIDSTAAKGNAGGASAAPTEAALQAVAESPSGSGLAVDAAGNLFIADAKQNVIRRLDAKSGAIGVVAGTGVAGYAGDGGAETRAEFNVPGDLAFDHYGNLFVADEGNHAIREIAQIGVAQATASVTLTPDSGINFGDQATGGATSRQVFTFTNNSSAALVNLRISFAGADPGEFSQSNSCGSSVAANSSCTINVTFMPRATGARSATLQVMDSDPSSPQTAPVSGFGDNFDILAQGSNSTTATVNIAAGSTATFHLQVVPDAVFSGSVALQCPINLPAQTTCTLTPTSVKVTAGKMQPFTAAFATMAHQVVPGAPEGRQFPAPRILVLIFAALVIFALANHRLQGRDATVTVANANGSVAAYSDTPLPPMLAPRLRARPQRGVVWALALGIVGAFAGGCHHYKAKAQVGTQVGTYPLTVRGSAQNAGRGITVTMIVQ